MIPTGAWRRVFLLRIAWYLAMIGVPTLGLTWAHDRVARWAALGWVVAVLVVVSSPLGTRRRAIAIVALGAIALAVGCCA